MEVGSGRKRMKGWWIVQVNWKRRRELESHVRRWGIAGNKLPLLEVESIKVGGGGNGEGRKRL